MFKKQIQCKPQSNLKNSDRKKIISDIGDSYKNYGGSLNTFQQGNFESVDGMIHGILYTIESVGRDDDVIVDNTNSSSSSVKDILPIWFKINKLKINSKFPMFKQTLMIPTVYTMWLNPELLPIVITNDFVLDDKIIKSGANLMKKGCYIPIDDIMHRPNIDKQCVLVGISSYKRPQCVKAIGYLNLNDENESGVAVTVVHTLDDKLCDMYNTKLKPSLDLLKEVDSDDDELVEPTKNKEEEEQEEQFSKVIDTENDVIDKQLYSVSEIDELLTQSMYYTLTNDDTLQLPISSSKFISNHININLPKRIKQLTDVNVKKSSFKKTNKMLKHWEKNGFISLKMDSKNKGDYIITRVCNKNDNLDLKNFISYQPRGIQTSSSSSDDSKQQSRDDKNKNKFITSVVLYKPTSPQAKKLFTSLTLSGNSLLQANDIRQFLEEYYKKNDLINKKTPSKILCNDTLWLLMGKKLNIESEQEKRLVARTTILDDVLKSSSQLMKYFQIYDIHGKPVLKEPQRLSNNSNNKIPTIKITTELKMKRKIITKIENNELYGIDSQELANILKTKCSASVTINDDLINKKKEILVQGPHEAIVLNLLQNDYHIQSTSPQFVTCENKLKNKKKSSTTVSTK